MRTHTARREGAVWIDLLRGLLLAVAATAALVALFALAISLFDFSDGVIRAVNQAIKLLAVYLGVRAATPQGCSRALLRGAGLGFVYMAAGVMVYALLSAQSLPALSYLADICLGTAFGALVGLMRARKN